MLVATLHWAGSGDVPAGNETGSQANSHQQSTTPPTCLGYVPHQIRGNVSTHTQLLFNAPAFGKCTACSDVVVNLFRGGQGDDRNEKRKKREKTKNGNNNKNGKNEENDKKEKQQ